jgi:hypothetical protein
VNAGPRTRKISLCVTHVSAELYTSKRKYRSYIGKIYEKWYGFTAKLLKEGQEEGLFRKDIDPDILAVNIVAAQEGNLIHWNSNIKKIEGGAFSRSYMKFQLHGIQNSPRYKKR